MDHLEPPEGSDSSAEPPHDTLLANCRREMGWSLLLWVVCFIWVIGYCGLFGYQVEGQEMNIVLGMPSWVVWGICLPWLVAVVVSSGFALWGIADDPLGETPEQETAPRPMEGPDSHHG